MAYNLGLPLGTVVNRYLQKFVEEQSITFERPEIPNAERAKILRQAERDIKAGKNLSPVFTNADDAIAWLHR